MDQERNGSPLLSRRGVCLGLGGVAVAAACEGLLPATTPPATLTDDQFLAMRLTEPSATLPRRAEPYVLTKTVIVPANHTLAIDADTHIVFRPATAPESLLGVFQAGGDNVAIVVNGGEAIVESATPSTNVYAATARAVSDFTVIGLRGHNCGHVYIDGGTPGSAYADISTAGPGANVARRIRIERGGASYDRRPSTGHGALMIRYGFDWSVTGCRYSDTFSGVEWWGGDANPVTGDGAAANERKCGNFVVKDVTVHNTAISGIWGSMGQDGVVSDCTISDCGDVGFDAEGCRRVTFRGCRSRDGVNGCFGTFFLNQDISFLNCDATATKSSLPVFRVHNPTLDMANNRRVVIRGGRWECRDVAGPSSIDTAEGPCAELTIEDAELVNVRIDTAYVGVHRTRIVGNRLVLPHPLGNRAAIRVGGSKTLGSVAAVGDVLVAGNDIKASAAGTAGIELFEDDTISSATATLRANRIAGPFEVGIRIVNASPNPTVRPSSVLIDNRFDLPSGTRPLAITVSKPDLLRPQVRWQSGVTAAGRPIQASEVLGRN